MTCTFHLYIKKDLYFAPKIKRSNIFLEVPVIGTFMELSYERKLGLYFSLLISPVLKIFSEFQIKQIEEVIWKVFFFSKGTVTTSVLSACKLFGRCADDPSVLELLQKMFCKIKTGKQITAISHENRAKTEKNSNNYQEKRKINWELNLFV